MPRSAEASSVSNVESLQTTIGSSEISRIKMRNSWAYDKIKERASLERQNNIDTGYDEFETKLEYKRKMRLHSDAYKELPSEGKDYFKRINQKKRLDHILSELSESGVEAHAAYQTYDSQTQNILYSYYFLSQDRNIQNMVADYCKEVLVEEECSLQILRYFSPERATQINIDAKNRMHADAFKGLPKADRDALEARSITIHNQTNN